MRRVLLRRISAPAIACLLLAGAVAAAQQLPQAPAAAQQLPQAPAAPQQLPQAPDPIRVRIAMVPVDVRIVDRQGNPVTDLKQEDFTLLEDGVPQDIRHFSTQALAADPAIKDAALLPRRAPGADVTPATRRVFLAMLGRGRHQAVVGGVDALSAFVRERLLPQDRMALMAWNRATDFTTDHALIARTVARYGQEAEAIETDLKQWFSGLRAIYGSKTIPPQIQRRIDAIFAEAGSRQPREVAPGTIPEAPRVREERRPTADDQIRRLPATALPGLPADPELGTAMSAEKAAALTLAFSGSTFDLFVAQATETFQDLGAVYAGIEYLRYLDGEKHLVFFTESGLRMSRREDNFALADAASDARIALDTIHTGGIAGPPPPRYVGANGTLDMQPIQNGWALFGEGMAAEDLRAISELTGGQATAFRKASDALDRIDRSTRFQYLLGYYPATAASDGKFRKLTVTVKRPGVTVLYRHGFYATEQLVPLDRRQFVTSSRVYEAGKYPRQIEDIKLTLKQPKVAERDVVLELHVDLSRVAFTQVNARYAAKLNVAVFVGGAKQAVVGETWRTLDLNANEANRDRLLREGTPVTITIPLPAGARDVKVVVYDYGSDLLGTAVARIQ